jgi:predicted nucleotidyltransferase
VELRADTKARGLEFIGAEMELSEIFGRKVDLVTNVREVLWPYVKDDLVLEYVEES